MFANLYERYKDLPFFKRALLIFFLSASYFSYDILTQYESLQIEKKAEEDKLFAEKKKLNQALMEVKRLPGIKKSLVEAEKEFESSKKRLPDDFYVEKLLETFSSLARKSGLELDLYDPGIPQKEEGSYTYISLPIAIIVTGKFNNIVQFMQSILNLNQLLEIRNYKMNLELGSVENSSKEGKSLSESEIQNMARKNSKVRLEASVYAFRSLSEKEFISVNSKELKKNKKKKRVRR